MEREGRVRERMSFKGPRSRAVHGASLKCMGRVPIGTAKTAGGTNRVRALLRELGELMEQEHYSWAERTK